MIGTQIEPTTKIIQLVLLNLCILFVRSNIGILLLALLCILFLIFLQERICALEFALWIIVMQFLFIVEESFTIPSILIATISLLKISTPLIGVILIIVKTLTVGQLVAGLTKLRMPKTIVLVLAICLRFIPTIRFEFSCIKDALRIRNKPLTILSLLKSPVEMTQCLTIPLMMRGIKIADELSASAVTRGMDCTTTRSYRKDMVGKPIDVFYLLVTLVSLVVITILEISL